MTEVLEPRIANLETDFQVLMEHFKSFIKLLDTIKESQDQVLIQQKELDKVLIAHWISHKRLFD